MTDALIKGWCPGALTPMRSGDGLIVRLRISGGIVGVDLATQIARWSRRWGNGQIELTGRGNLQLRGLSEPHLAHLHDALTEWNLLDASAAGEAVRNVICSPLAGLDPTAVLDIRPIVRALEQRFANDVALHELPAKFGFAIDDGGELGLDGVPADIRFRASVGLAGSEFMIALAGAPDVWSYACRPDALVDTAAALGLAFVKMRRGREDRVRRMRDLVAVHGVEAIANEATIAGAAIRTLVTPEHDGGRHEHYGAAEHEGGGHVCEPARRHARGTTVILGLDPMGAKLSHLMHPTPAHSPLSPGSTGGSAEPHREVTDGPVKPDHDDKEQPHPVDTFISAPGGLNPRISRGNHKANTTNAVAASDARVEPEHDGRGGEHDGGCGDNDGGRGDHDRRSVKRDSGGAGRDGGLPVFVGVGLPVGAIAAEDLAVLASAAAEAGARELRLTPWRVVLVPVASIESGRAMVAGLMPTPFILDQNDPRRRVAACPGAPACEHGTTTAREDAVRLAERLGDAPGTGIVLHVSGCEKGCAYPRTADVTLVGRDGRYDLVVGGSASSPPKRRGLEFSQIVDELARITAGSAWGSPA